MPPDRPLDGTTERRAGRSPERPRARARPDRLRVVLASMVAGVPGHGGWVWAVMHWALGLRQLGHDVLLLEPTDDPTPARRAAFDAVAAAFGLAGAATMVGPRSTPADPGRAAAGRLPGGAAGERAGHPMTYGEVGAWCASADLLVNIAGALTDPELFEPVPARLYVDVDPCFTQLWQAAEGIDMHLDGHSAHATVGLNVGTSAGDVPTCGVDWMATPPPVVVDRWPEDHPLEHRALTTVANWRGYGSVDRGGVLHGQKAHSWRALLGVGARSTVPCTPALAIHPDEEPDLAALREHRWTLLDPAAVAGTPEAYHRFVSGSLAELAVAKSGYVVSRSGWFSDRSACYLAAGRPVIAQDTGFADHLPTGQGLLAFDDVDGALEAIAAVEADYERHRRAARAVATEHLDARRVLPRLIDHANGSTPR